MNENNKNEIELIPEGEVQICQFAGSNIRKILHNDEWFFSIVDVVTAMTDSSQPSRYWNELKTKLADNEGANQLFGKIEKLPIKGADGRSRLADTGNTETIFRIIQSIPSPKAEPFKRWLAKVGYERIQEHQNPAIAIKRAIVDYHLQGHTVEWIEARLRALVSRKELTDEWHARGIKESWEFAVLTDEIYKGTFGKTNKEYKEYKGLKKNHDLRNNMTSMELILTMLGETSTKQLAQQRDAKGFYENKTAAQIGGSIAGDARKRLEQELGRPVVSSENNLKKLGPSNEMLKLPDSFDESIKRMSRVPPQKKKPE